MGNFQGFLAQLVEHFPYKEGVTGSNPVEITIINITKENNMACTYTGSVEGDRAYDAQMRAEAYKKEIDLVTRLLCFVTHRFEKINPSVYKGLLKENKELQDWVTQHEAVDAARWYEFYKGEYPNYSLEEIAKAVKSGMLKEI